MSNKMLPVSSSFFPEVKPTGGERRKYQQIARDGLQLLYQCTDSNEYFNWMPVDVSIRMMNRGQLPYNILVRTKKELI